MNSYLRSSMRIIVSCLIVYIAFVVIATPDIWRKADFVYVNAATGEIRREERFMGIRLTTVTQPTILTLYAKSTANAGTLRDDWHLVRGGYREKLTAFGPALRQIGLLTNAWHFAGHLSEDVKRRTADDVLRLWAHGRSCHLSGRYISDFAAYVLQSEVNPDTQPISISELDRLMYAVTNTTGARIQPR